MSNPLRKARDARGLSQADLAARLDVTQGTISNWETGSFTPDPKLWRDIARAYGVGVETLTRFFLRAAA